MVIRVPGNLFWELYEINIYLQRGLIDLKGVYMNYFNFFLCIV